MNLNEIILVASILIFAFILIYLQNKAIHQDDNNSVGTINKVKLTEKGLEINGTLNKRGKKLFKKGKINQLSVGISELYEITPVLMEVKTKKGSVEYKKILSEKAKERWAKPEYREKMKKAFKNKARNKKGQFKKVKK